MAGAAGHVLKQILGTDLIGERMNLAEKTVKNYASVLFQKLGMERRAPAAPFAAQIFGGQDEDEYEDERADSDEDDDA